MSFEPCSDIRLKIHAAKILKDENTDIEKENKKPAGVATDTSSFRGRGRGLLSIRQRMRERKKQSERK